MNYIESGIRTRINEEYDNLDRHIQEVGQSKRGSADRELAYQKMEGVESLIKGLQIALEIAEERS